MNTPKYRRQQFEPLRGERRRSRDQVLEIQQDSGKRHPKASEPNGK